MTAEAIFSYIFPPLLGAGIGYLTNFIAIRMLFRPLEPWRVLARRVPLTPGIIPAKRKLLAEKIGKVVGEHLLTPEDAGEALEEASFLKELRTSVNLKLNQWLHQDIGPIAAFVAEEHQEHLQQFLASLNSALTNTLFDYLGTDQFRSQLTDFMLQKESDFLAHDLESVLGHQALEKAEHYLSKRLDEWLLSDRFEEALQRNIEHRADQLLNAEKPLRDIIPEKFLELAFKHIDRGIPVFLEKCSHQLYTPAIRQELAAKIEAAIKNFMESLEGLSGFFAGFINLEKIHAKIPDFLDHTGDELSRWMEQEETREKVSQLVHSKILLFLEHSPKDLLQKLPYEKIAEVRQVISRQALAISRSPQWKSHVLDALDSSFQRIKDISLRGLLEKVLRADDLEKMQAQLTETLLAGLQSEQSKEVFSTLLLNNFEQWALQRPAGKLCDYIPSAARDWLEDNAYRYILNVLKTEIPAFVESFNIRKMVTAKVDSLDVLAVEGLLLSIMEEHFVYINLFGALLGFIIGCLNIVV